MANTLETLRVSGTQYTLVEIYVPCDSVSAYKSASSWSSYASRIQAIPGSCAPTLQWVEFNDGDTIDSTLDIYGVSGNSYDLSVFYLAPIEFNPSRNKVDIYILDSLFVIRIRY